MPSTQQRQNREGNHNARRTRRLRDSSDRHETQPENPRRILGGNSMNHSELVTGVQRILKEFAETHPGEITLPCEKHHRIPCVECGIIP